MTIDAFDVGTAVDASAGAAGPELVVKSFPEGESHVIQVAGELDLATRAQVPAAAAATDHTSVIIDLSGVTFMDFSGFASIEATRLAIESGGRTLTVRGATGQPAHLLDLIAELDRTQRVTPSAGM
ncbi:MAG: STAS domain-containing protein [Actinomycetota bacterium]|nr:STAS domain-containing protein [Actinomycetota bacterium]